MNIPKSNLIHEGDNESLYIERLTDEIIRYDNISMFIFDPNMYLSMIQQNYDLNNDEVLVPQSILDKDYFDAAIKRIEDHKKQLRMF